MMTLALAAKCVVLAAAPLADVWPYKAQLMTDGAVEYVYDLSAVKSAAAADAKEAHGADKVAEFQKSLPKEAKVRLAGGYGVSLKALGSDEAAPVSASFAGVPDDAFTMESVLGKKNSAKLRPALHPDEPHVLLSADALVVTVREFEEAALAASELEIEPQRRAFWSSIIAGAVKRLPDVTGDSREGVMALLARVGAATACLDAAKVNPQLAENSELKTAVTAEMNRLSALIELNLMPSPWVDRPGLSCAWVRDTALSLPLENSRAGTAAVLTMVELLDHNAKLSATFDAIRTRRNATVGMPAKVESFNVWRAHATGKAGTLLEALNEFIEALPSAERTPGALLAAGTTPVQQYLAEIEGAARGTAADELVSAAEENRLVLKGDTWPVSRDRTLVAIGQKERNVETDAAMKDRQLNLVAAMAHLPRQGRDVGDADRSSDVADRTELKVRLNVPPMLELEPSPALLQKLADSLTQLGTTFQVLKLQSLNPVWADGSKDSAWVFQEANRLSALLHGLALLADPSTANSVEAAVARKFVQSWRADPRFKRDVRRSATTNGITRQEHQHVAIAGVSRRQVSVGFATAPTAKLVEANSAFAVNSDVEQKYLVPVIVGVAAPAPRDIAPLKVNALRKMFDAQPRKPTELEGVLLEHLHSK